MSAFKYFKLRKPNIDKIFEAFSYVTEQMPAKKKNTYNILKVFYLADKLHMERYGRFIFNDVYAAMKKGPVPSKTYNFWCDIRDGKPLSVSKSPKITIVNNYAKQIEKPDLKVFSKSDLSCIDEVIEISKKSDLGALSHDEAWKNAEVNQLMDMKEVIKTLEDGDLLLDLHKNIYA
ncbi:type II toxin-antitoxin system antitoxin SocA domain-containing protein [Marinicella meishanensis]|uniref:type II toxin-antitoxin system antitoxin SocA domain-containing protein n=1 Tax=Marinicella meishanensis TaxID=2873263 RepID=UPI001CBD90B0|nr:Panacea domain-containing protein [Marinicella sp. NBU2979]